MVTHPDEILRTVATAMAAHGIDRMPVVSRDDPRRIVGLVSLTMLLAGRLRTLQHARDAERVLRLRVVRPKWLTGRDLQQPTVRSEPDPPASTPALPPLN